MLKKIIYFYVFKNFLNFKNLDNKHYLYTTKVIYIFQFKFHL